MGFSSEMILEILHAVYYAALVLKLLFDAWLDYKRWRMEVRRK